jgi:hypothetical protein
MGIRYYNDVEKLYIEALKVRARNFVEGKRQPEDTFSLEKMKERMRELAGTQTEDGGDDGE